MKSKYFIAIVPAEPLQSRIMDLKQQAAGLFNSKGALRSPAHITLHMPFELEGKKEERFLESFALLETPVRPFEVHLSGFDFFPPRVVFIDVKNSAELQQLQGDVVEFMKMRFHIFNQSDDMRGFHPHVTIAFRDLKKPEFYRAKEFFSAKSFDASFVCNEVTLLKHDGMRWNECMRAEIKKP